MKKEREVPADEALTRRTFMKGGAGALLAASCLTSLGSRAGTAQASTSLNSVTEVYICPPCGAPCDKLTFDKPGDCPNCGMTLVPLGGGKDSPPTVAILLFNGAELIDFAGPWEVFGTAGFLVHTVAEKSEPLIMVFGQTVIPDYTFDNSPKADILLVPGGAVFDHMKDDTLINWIQKKSKEVSHVMSVCTGAFLLQKAGLLEGQTVTATYGMIEDLATPQTKVIYDQRFVDNGKIITTAGLSSGIDGAFHLLSRILGKGRAQAAALAMEYNWDPDSKWTRANLADRYLPDGLAYGKPKLKGAEAQLISTAGSTDHWETKLLVSSPSSSSEIVDLLRNRIGSSTASQGMFRPMPHMRSTPTLSPKRSEESAISWTFTDDQGRNWNGLGSVEAAADDRGKFIVTLKLMRS
jgi:putative intracellular protease/amidase/DNA-directed RNA polymerase subunit RPC12/RpoP